ncbi:HlyD family secretion protein [Mesorhizobium albiziae]|uniref:Membrane fusion protein (MFP) family protein n=1 Tax=Neomesorhizobium albiziae TaxID=335020 RepID=A0A1I4DQZ9_9HYPH|nr:HlyD family type I secretion periplasmic adaptor subunit [Mesorhizobium albiziae]GLS31259.1 HlyD family type I secretion periplasmic adaptor subunit [Mesorhizobium albiziae]SFK94727.1 HlyD family secretion protein [Mesorhizobium albiziae]
MSDIAAVHDIEWYSQVPRSIWRQTAIGLALIAMTFGGFGVWAATAPLAAAVIAQGSFVATGQNKIIQHLEGGVIKDLLVNEGDRVTAGQPLVMMDETAALARERQLFLRQMRLEAIVARLTAQQTGASAVIYPRAVDENRDDPDLAPIIENQELNFHATLAKMRSEIGLLEQNVQAMKHRREGFQQQLDSVERQRAFLEEELSGKQVLFKQGLMRKPELNALQRAIADAQGQAGRLISEVQESTSQVARFEQQIGQTKDAYRQAALDELQGIEAELDTVRQQSEEAKNVLQRVTIHAPVSGTIVRMYYHTDGGVIESGKSIMEILPADVPLMIEAQISRTDIDDVDVGQNATVRLVGLNQRITPVLDGEVFYVSADSLPDASPTEPREIYLARISLPLSEIQRVPGFVPTPGMPAEVMVQTEERTFLSYLVKPITDTMARAFSER